MDLTATPYRYLLLAMACTMSLGWFFVNTSLYVLEIEIQEVIKN
jgi:hypothetical protein